MATEVKPKNGAGGGTLSVQAPSDLTGVTVGGAAVASLVDGQLVHTAEPDAYWRYHTAQDAAPSPGTVINNAGGGQFLRDLTYHGLLDVQESGWYVDGALGNDDANGKTLGTAIKTWAELQRRIGNPDVVAPPSAPFVIEVFVSSPPPDVLQGDFFAPAGTEVRILATSAIPAAPVATLAAATPASPTLNIRSELIANAPPLFLASETILYDLTAECWIVLPAIINAGAGQYIWCQPYYSSQAPSPFTRAPFSAIAIADGVAPSTLMPITVGDIDGHARLTLEGFDLSPASSLSKIVSTRLVACQVRPRIETITCRQNACLLKGCTITDSVDSGGSRFGWRSVVQGSFDEDLLIDRGLMAFCDLTWNSTSNLDGLTNPTVYSSGAMSISSGFGGESAYITIPPNRNIRLTGDGALFGSSADVTGRNVCTLVLNQASVAVCQKIASCSIPDANSVEFALSSSAVPVVLPNSVFDPALLTSAPAPYATSVRDRFGSGGGPSDLNAGQRRWLCPTTMAYTVTESP